MSIFGCRNYSGSDDETCSQLRTCNHCQLIEALEEIADTQRRLINLLKDGKFTLESKEVGKYGRVLGVLLIDDLNINKTLVEEGYAVEYWGGKKKK